MIVKIIIITTTTTSTTTIIINYYYYYKQNYDFHMNPTQKMQFMIDNKSS